MVIKDLMNRFHLNSIKINARFAEVDFNFENMDKEAAWELYVEMITRVITQPLPKKFGDEEAALNSVYSIFKTVRDILKQKGPKSINFAKVTIPILNQMVRPFTTKWHKESVNNAFTDPEKCKEFREELELLRTTLVSFTKLLAEMAEVEDISEIECD